MKNNSEISLRTVKISLTSLALLVCLFLVSCNYGFEDRLKYKLFTEQEFLGKHTLENLSPSALDSQEEEDDLDAQQESLQERLSALTLAFYWGLKLHVKFQKIQMESVGLQKEEKLSPLEKWKAGYFLLNPRDLLNPVVKKALDENNITPNQFLYWRNFLAIIQNQYRPWREKNLAWRHRLESKNKDLKDKFNNEAKSRNYYDKVAGALDKFYKEANREISSEAGDLREVIARLKDSSVDEFDKIMEKNFSPGLYWAILSQKMETYGDLTPSQKKRYKSELINWQGEMARRLNYLVAGKKLAASSIDNGELMELARIFVTAVLLDQYPFRNIVLSRDSEAHKSSTAQESLRLYRKEYLPYMINALFSILVHGESSTSLWSGQKNFYLTRSERGTHISLREMDGLYSFRYSKKGKPCLFVSPHRLGNSLFTHFSLEFNPHFGYFGIEGWRKDRIKSAWPEKDSEGNVEGNFTVTTFTESEIFSDLHREAGMVRKKLPSLIKEIVPHFGFYRLISFRSTMDIPKDVQVAMGLIPQNKGASENGEKAMVKVKSNLFTERLTHIIKKNYGQTHFSENFGDWKFHYVEEPMGKVGVKKVVARFLNENPLLLSNLPKGRILYWCGRYRDIWAVSSAELRKKLVFLETEFREKLSKIFIQLDDMSREMVGPEVVWLAFPGTKVKPIVVREGLLTWLRSYKLGNPRFQTIPRELSTYEFSFDFLYEKNKESLKERFEENQYFDQGFWLILPLLPENAYGKDSKVFRSFFQAYGASLLHFNMEKLPEGFRRRHQVNGKVKMDPMLEASDRWSSGVFASLKSLEENYLEKNKGIGRPLEDLLAQSFLNTRVLLPDEKDQSYLPFSYFYAERNIVPFAIFSKALPETKDGMGKVIAIEREKNKFLWNLSLKRKEKGEGFSPGDQEYFILPGNLEENVLKALNIPSPGSGAYEELKSMKPVFTWLRNSRGKILYIYVLRNSAEKTFDGKVRYTVLWDTKTREKWSVRNPKIRFNVEEIYVTPEIHETIQAFLKKKSYDK